mmetsp:Transcript_8433/g.15619  ORF Transcript_8433/g.15619 Transcript_8433/m.15619 type:complete len:400 (+) Transcript_8433:214-1413(+)|eukprot:CAMPEP_0197530300 /NCGR_PEP_ID=MMETSP1318-20131121/31381_1 /TAXON_ID=552666 /ORGANISM="Partenskyella glossopodia, Strain RCC365" /LENGTH=399 /DNA_ID=CAMNT_0043086063 /DNA_START=189 /DNA_END=1388 /DNA_ORIENTATION=+
MGDYTDEWVVQSSIHVLFFGGGCSCCGMSALQGDLSKYLSMCTDASDPELLGEASLDSDSPWPYYVKEEVWKDRVKFRSNLKVVRKHFSKLKDWDSILKRWMQIPLEKRKKACIVEVSRLHQYASKTFSRPYRIVLLKVMEQVFRFNETEYPMDGVSRNELGFEQALIFVEDSTMGEETGYFSISSKCLEDEKCMRRFFSDFGESLLPRKNSTTSSRLKEGNGEGDRSPRAPLLFELTEPEPRDGSGAHSQLDSAAAEDSYFCQVIDSEDSTDAIHVHVSSASVTNNTASVTNNNNHEKKINTNAGKQKNNSVEGTAETAETSGEIGTTSGSAFRFRADRRLIRRLLHAMVVKSIITLTSSSSAAISEPSSSEMISSVPKPKGKTEVQNVEKLLESVRI